MTDQTIAKTPVTHAPDGSTFADHHWWTVALLTTDTRNGQQGMIMSMISTPPTCQCGQCEMPSEEMIVHAQASATMQRQPWLEIAGGTALYMSDSWHIQPYNQADSATLMDPEGNVVAKEKMN